MSRPLYLHALLRAGDTGCLAALPGELPRVAGTGPLRALRFGTLAAAVADLVGEPPRAARRSLLAHARLLEAAMELCTVLPVPFGRVLKDEQALADALAGHEARLHAELARFDGRAEYGLRVQGSREGALAAIAAAEPAFAVRSRDLGGGAEGYQARIALGRAVAERLAERRGRAQSALLRVLAPLADMHLLRAPENDCELLRAEFLLRRQDEERFAAAAAAAVASIGFAAGSAPSVQLVGPAPVFNFCRLHLASTTADADARVAS